MPYRTQLVPLAAVLSRLGDRWLEPRIYDKLTRWFWSGVLGELYGGAVETRMANDYEELLDWFEDDDALPRTVREANFQPDRFNTLRSRLSAAYKGINVLVLREGSKDWYWKATIQELDAEEIALDIHHIFPRDWCEKQGIGKDRYDSVLKQDAHLLQGEPQDRRRGTVPLRAEAPGGEGGRLERQQDGRAVGQPRART